MCVCKCGDAWQLVRKYTLEPNSDVKKFKQQATFKIKQEYINDWYNNIQNLNANPICRTYSKFKFKFQMEPYLIKIKDYKLRKALTKLRTSSHRLRIETGRHKRQADHEHDDSRLCSQCNLVEDEAHFVLHCPRYINERSTFFSNPYLNNSFFVNLSDDDKLLYIFNMYEKHHLCELAKFIHSSFLIHSDIIQV